jgi:hypothetical protein
VTELSLFPHQPIFSWKSRPTWKCQTGHGITPQKVAERRCDYWFIEAKRLKSGLQRSSDLESSKLTCLCYKAQTTQTLVKFHLNRTIRMSMRLEKFENGKSPESVCHDLQLITPSLGAAASDLRACASRSAPSHPYPPITPRRWFFKTFTERGCQGFGVLDIGDWSKEHGIRADHSLALSFSYQPQTCSDHFLALSHILANCRCSGTLRFELSKYRLLYLAPPPSMSEPGVFPSPESCNHEKQFDTMFSCQTEIIN